MRTYRDRLGVYQVLIAKMKSQRKCSENSGKLKSLFIHAFNSIFNDHKRSSPAENKMLSLCKLITNMNMFLKINLSLPDYVSKKKKQALRYLLRMPRNDREKSAGKNSLDKLGGQEKQLSIEGKSAGKTRIAEIKYFKEIRSQVLRLFVFPAVKTIVSTLTGSRRLPVKKVLRYSESTWQRNARCKIKIHCKSTLHGAIIIIIPSVRRAARLASLLRPYYHVYLNTIKESGLSKQKEGKKIYTRDAWHQRCPKCWVKAAPQNLRATLIRVIKVISTRANSAIKSDLDISLYLCIKTHIYGKWRPFRSTEGWKH